MNRLYLKQFNICKDGSRIPVEIKTHILKIEGEKFTLSVCRDILERQKAERVIRDTKEQYQQLLNLQQMGLPFYKMIEGFL
jgi:two-component system sporulation sensor kinase A